MCSAAQSVVSPKVSFPHQHAYIWQQWIAPFL
jgi:hypothetical protein